ncbi:uncharacterized protein [Diabrotica undecimpunctata]|uniref:uncharacterized protein n=1 Tax=Diabrotica undecimpunctata TaxID=50387 RepID=UPI003B638303
MPPGSVVYMSEESAYINSSIFLAWLRDQFTPRKPQGNVLLIVDSHSSHCSDPDILEYAEQNGITLFCTPSHTTQFLQPLERALFKSLKLNYQFACNSFMNNNPARKIAQLQFGKSLKFAWGKSATVSNAVSAFVSTGIVPLDSSVIPNDAFLSMEDNVSKEKEINPHLSRPELQPKAGYSNWSDYQLDKRGN